MPRYTVMLDFETISACDIKKSGAWRYAEDPSTRVLCLRSEASLRPGVIDSWVPGEDLKQLFYWACDPDAIFCAFNASFEKAIWRHIMIPQFNMPDVPNERWHDVQAVCAMKALPQKLERVTPVLRLPVQKDLEGNRLIQKLNRQARAGNFAVTPEQLTKTVAYCGTDVQTQSAVHRRVGWQTPEERRVWLFDQTINERGVRFDLPFIAAAREVVAKATVPLAEEFKQITGGLSFTQRDKIMEWLKTEGVFIPNLAKDTLKQWLGSDEEEDDDASEWDTDFDVDLPPQVHRALSIRRLIGSASIKKLPSMELYCGADSRARGLLQYHGAGPGLWAGRGPQPQNYPRGSLVIGDAPPDPELVVDAIMTRDPDYVACLFGPPVEAVVSGLRHAIVAEPGRLLNVGDFSQIQARIVLALAGQFDKVEMLAQTGSATYCSMASQIYKRPIDKKTDVAEYTIGKSTVLGCGFQMGDRKFFARYGKGHTLAFCTQVVQTYRKEWAPRVPDLWAGLEEAALETVLTGRAHEAYGVEYRLEDGWMTARLPNGRKLWYWNPQRVQKAMPWDETDIRVAWTYQAMKMGQWKTIDAFGGLLTENVVTAIARDILVDAMFRAEQNGMRVILTVHDELVTEPLAGDADPKALKQMMETRAPWLEVLRIPIGAECWAGPRYKK